ncbi:glutamate--tRNA ligase family protein [Escherichia coli]
MASPFIVMRDPVLYRIKFAEHHQTGNKWCIYPSHHLHPLHQRCPGRYYALSVYA